MKTAGIKCTAALLLLLFSQKLGLQLYLHNWFHVTQSQQAAGGSTADGQFHLACDCLDEALMPLSASTSIEIAVEEKIIKRPYVSILEIPIISLPKNFRALRGPPVA